MYRDEAFEPSSESGAAAPPNPRDAGEGRI